jgi:hypothetical protein
MDAAVDSYYRMAFPDEQNFWEWTERIAEFAAIMREVFVDQSELHAVIFVPQWPAQGVPIRAYVSACARGVAMRMSRGALIDRSTAISAAELPPGLTMLLGDERDEAEYERRHAWGRLLQTTSA